MPSKQGMKAREQRTLRPNDEQREIMNAVSDGNDTIAIAGAGTGKTSTMELIARAIPKTRILYLAFNKAAQLDAADRMPSNVTCKTSHALAYGPVGRTYASRLNQGRVPSWKLAQQMGYNSVNLSQSERMPAAKVASMVRRTVDRFCHSADPQIEPYHVPWLSALGDDENTALRQIVRPLAAEAWDDVLQSNGKFPFTFDSYLKIYQLGEPRLPYDLIVLDEAQDTNPCVADIVLRQKGKSQLVMVGDPQQAIYEWRGAVDAMQKFAYDKLLMLTGSYRFGQAVADEANLWLEALGSDLRLKGYKKLTSVVQDEAVENPSAILCRGNAGAIVEAMTALDQGKSVAIVGGGGPIAALARAAAQLMSGAVTDHPDLIAFKNWAEVRQYVKEEREDAGSLAPLVRLVDNQGVEAILAMCNALVDEQRGKPEIVVSTAHKAKGREWDRVQISGDFMPPKRDEELRPDEGRLAYVTVTRAKQVLGRGSLRWMTDQDRATAREMMDVDRIVADNAGELTYSAGPGGAGMPAVLTDFYAEPEDET